MAEKNVDINFRTKADTKGARDTEKGLKNVGRASMETEKVLGDVENSARDIREELEKLDGLDPKLKKEILGLADSLDRTAEAGRKVAASQTAGKKANSKAALGFLEVSRAVEDAQYGMRGVLNNIPQIIMLFGGAAGLAGAVSIAAVALSQLGPLLLDTGERSEEAAEMAASLAEEIKAVSRAATDSKLESLSNHIKDVSDSLALQNLQLKSNRVLLAAKRKEEMLLAGLDDESELADIAIRAATDPSFTKEMQNEAELQVKLRKLQREKDQKIFEAQQRLESAFEDKVATQNELSVTEKAHRDVSSRILELRTREGELIAARLKASQDLENAEELRGSILGKVASLWGVKTNQNAAELLEEGALESFGADEEAELENVQRSLTQAFSNQSSLEDKRRQLENQVSAQFIAIEQSEKLLALAQRNAETTAERKAELMIAENTLEQANKSAGEITKNVEEVLKAAGELDTTNTFEAGRVRNVIQSLEQILSDGVVTEDEFGRVVDALNRLTSTQSGNVEKIIKLNDRLQVSVDRQEGRLQELERSQRILEQKINQTGGRR